ncbi:MAG: hypothetical protein M3N53_03605 [Actinomycetota bacterium]|nr:hypothetical protein [Actinomycetota bacterium]
MASLDGRGGSSMKTRDGSAGVRPSRRERFPQLVALVFGAMTVLFGAWAFFDPRSFFDNVAVFEPFNRHFIHDIGAFQIGLGSVLVLGAILRDSLQVVLSGVGVGAVFHVISHILDRDIGGKPATDIPFFALTAAILVAAAVARTDTVKTDRSQGT